MLGVNESYFRPQYNINISSRSPSLRVCGAVHGFFSDISEADCAVATNNNFASTSHLEEKNRIIFVKDTCLHGN